MIQAKFGYFQLVRIEKFPILFRCYYDFFIYFLQRICLNKVKINSIEKKNMNSLKVKIFLRIYGDKRSLNQSMRRYFFTSCYQFSYYSYE